MLWLVDLGFGIMNPEIPTLGLGFPTAGFLASSPAAAQLRAGLDYG